ncbi:MAG: hypothetical protein WEB58_16800 [Planctomycetaceae bacterium]
MNSPPQRDKSIAVFAAAAVILASFFLLWIVPPHGAQTVPDHPLLSADIDFEEVEWKPELVSGGFLDEEAIFQQYVQQSTLIVTGRLIEWDWENERGRARIETRIFGVPRGEIVDLVPDGPSPTAQAGDHVLIMLTERYGETRLNAFCPISGVFAYNDKLAAMVVAAIRRKG